MDKASIGFGATLKKNLKDEKTTQGYLDNAQPADLTAYGLIPEFVGRFPLIVSTKALDEDALVDVMTLPKNALLKQYDYLFGLNDIEFHVTDQALLFIATVAKKRGTGARGLRSITENMLMKAFYVAPSLEDISAVVVDLPCAEGKKEPLILRGTYGMNDFKKDLTKSAKKGGREDVAAVKGKCERVFCDEHGRINEAAEMPVAKAKAA